MDVDYNGGTIGCDERILDFSYRAGEVQDLPCFFTHIFLQYINFSFKLSVLV